MNKFNHISCEKQHQDNSSEGKTKYLRFMQHIVFFFLFGLTNASFAQNNLWVLGNQLADFSGTTITLTALPQPGTNPGLHYTGQVPEKNQAVQFDNNGSLLFFIIDGNIYDGDGYVIALNEDNLAELDENEFPAFPNDVAVTNVPGYCDKFYLISTCQQATFSVNEEVVCTILDLSVQNPIFSGDPTRLGALMNGDMNDDLYNN